MKLKKMTGILLAVLIAVTFSTHTFAGTVDGTTNTVATTAAGDVVALGAVFNVVNTGAGLNEGNVGVDLFVGDVTTTTTPTLTLTTPKVLSISGVSSGPAGTQTYMGTVDGANVYNSTNGLAVNDQVGLNSETGVIGANLVLGNYTIVDGGNLDQVSFSVAANATNFGQTVMPAPVQPLP